MKGIEEFIKLFGDITVLQIVEFVLACVFMYYIYSRVKKFFKDRIEEENKRAEAEKARDERINDIANRLTQMEESTKRRERNKIRDRLLQNYRYYVNPETNPSHSWTQMESEAFWELFTEYEDAGGDGYMHTEVMPAMQLLTVVVPGQK